LFNLLIEKKERRTESICSDLTGLDNFFVEPTTCNLPIAFTVVSCTALSALLWSTLVMEFMRELDNMRW